MRLSAAATAVASAIVLAACASPEEMARAPYGTLVSGTTVESVPPAREVVVERAPSREVVVERAPARDVVVERVPDRVVVAPSERVYVTPGDTVVGSRAFGRTAGGTAYDREIVLGSNTRTITVNRDEIVKFTVPSTGRSFVWNFNTSMENTTFPFASIAPTDVRVHPDVMVNVVGPGRQARY
jgi:hypothetical protein